MSDIPSLPLFIDDFEAATAHLTLEEDGTYNRLLRLCWRQSGCSIPDDDDWIRRRMRVSEEDYLRVVKPIIDEFFSREKGRIFQRRLRAEHEYVLERISARKEAGKKGGLAKAKKTRTKEPSKAKNLPAEKSSKTLAPNPRPTPIPDLEDSPPTPQRGMRARRAMGVICSMGISIRLSRRPGSGWWRWSGRIERGSSSRCASRSRRLRLSGQSC